MKANWQKKSLHDVCEFEKRQGIHKGLPYVGLEDIESNTGRFTGSRAPVSVKSTTFRFSPEHLLYGRLRPYLNKVMAPDFIGHCSTEIFPIKPSPSLSREFLHYWFLRDETVSQINATSTGARMPRANMNSVLDFQFLLPPLAEQRRIVVILDKAFDAIATAKSNTEKNLQNTRAVFESHLHTVFSKRGEGWVEKVLGEVCELFQGLCINAKTKHLLVARSPLPLLRIKDLRTNSAEQFVASSGWPKNSQVRESDIIYTRTGQIGLVFRGRAGILHNNCFRVKPGPMLNADYLFWWLQNPTFRARITLLASKAAQPDITHSLFKEQPMLVPPVQHQNRVMDLVDKMRQSTQRLESIYQQKLAALESLKKSLLHQAFSGQL